LGFEIRISSSNFETGIGINGSARVLNRLRAPLYAYEDEWEQGPTHVFDCSYETKQLVAKSWATLSVRKSQDEYVNGPGIPFIDFLVAFQIKNWYNGKLGIIAVALLLLVDRGPEIVRPAESTHRYSIPPQAYSSLAGTSETGFLIYSLSCPGSHHR
jgi:hypothetical protein